MAVAPDARVRLGFPYACRAAVATAAAGWPAAGYGALAITVAGHFDVTGSGWIFGWPFAAMLAAATTVHLLVMGLDVMLGLPPLHAGIAAVNRAVDANGRPTRVDDQALRAAVDAVARVPKWDAIANGLVGFAVVIGCLLLEWQIAGPSSPNFGIILRSGMVACAIYVSTGVLLAELAIRPGHRALRREALQRGLQTGSPWVLARSYRRLAAIVPQVAAFAVAIELAMSTHATGMAYGALVGLSVLVTVLLAWLQSESLDRAVREVIAASRALAKGEEGRVLTGSIDPTLVELAEEFNAAAHRVRADRRASNERYRALFDGASDAILLLDPATGRIVEASARAERLFGAPRDEIVDRPFASCIDPGTAERLQELALERRERAEVAFVNAAIMRPDGATVPVDVSIAMVAAGDERVLQAILRDVRDRQRIEQELRRAARRFEELYRLAVVLGDDPQALADHTVRASSALLECPRACVAVVDGDSARVLAAVGIPSEYLTERRPFAGPCAEVLIGDRPYVFSDVTERFPGDADLAAIGVRAYCGVPIVDGSGTAIGVVSVADVQVRQFRDEDVQLLASFARRIGQALERERLSAERDGLTSRLVEADRLKTEFLGMMSHELRTPLNILLGYTRMLLEGIDDGDVMTGHERREILERMLAGGLHLGELVEDTLSVLRLEAGVVQADPSPLAFDAFFEELQSVDRLLPRPSGVVERWTVDPDVPTLATDRRKLRQVVMNLVGNARKFTETGVIEVHASADSAAGGVRITVRDTGCGIGPVHLPYVFDLYRQAPTLRKHDGCGLGLYIVRRYVELLGGRVSCSSTLGVGTTFVVELPSLAAASDAAAA